MLKKYLGLNLLFAMIFILQLIAEIYDIGILKLVIKPAITVSLMLGLIFYTRLKGRFHKRLLSGLLFALIGDSLLIFANQDNTLFTYGLLAFLICHLCYLSAFYLDFRSAPQLDKKGARIAIAVCAVFSTCFFFYLRPHLGIMRVPVLAYILVISFMTMMASFRNQRVNRQSFTLILTGAILFMVSDALLASDKFVSPIKYSGVWIIAIYMLAQYFITVGAIERKLIATD